MKRPRPKAEVVVEECIGAQLLHITAYSGDAQEWVEDEAPGFGELAPPTSAKHWREYNLWVGSGYDIGEVKAWLESQGDL